jgi:hypothetical protein
MRHQRHRLFKPPANETLRRMREQRAEAVRQAIRDALARQEVARIRREVQRELLERDGLDDGE